MHMIPVLIVLTFAVGLSNSSSPVISPTLKPTESPKGPSWQLSYKCDSLHMDQWINQGSLGNSTAYNIAPFTGTATLTPAEDGNKVLPALCFNSSQTDITFINYDTNSRVNPELTMEIWIKSAVSESTACLSRAYPGCYTIQTESECLSSQDGRTKYTGPCVWCGGGRCTGNNMNKCEPKEWLFVQPNQLNTHSYTVASCTNRNAWVLGHDNGGYDRSIIVHDNRYGGIAMGVGSSYPSLISYPTMNEWTQIIATFGRSTGKATIYKHSIAGGEEMQVVTITADSGSTETRIGLNGLHLFDHHTFTGCIAQVQIINRVLSAAEISILYDEFDQVISNGCDDAHLMPTESPRQYSNPFEYNMSFEWLMAENIFLSDPFGRFEAHIEASINDKHGVSAVTAACKSCFIWQYRKMSDGEWINVDDEANDEIFVTTQARIDDSYIISLTVQSIRTEKSGYCVNDIVSNSHIFHPNEQYQLRLRVTIPRTNSDLSDFVFTSSAIEIYTNSLPMNGTCSISNIEDVLPLDTFYFNCNNWYSSSELEYNALIDDVLVNKQGFVNNASLLSSVAQPGNVTITVLIKDASYDKAITCYDINQRFEGIPAIIKDHQTNGSLSDILDKVSALKNINETISVNNLNVADKIGAIYFFAPLIYFMNY